MKRLTKFFKGGQKGFTLIELLIVIVILGVLAAAIIPNLSKFMGSGKLGAANAELASVRTGIAAYQADNGGTAPTGSVAFNKSPLVAGDVVGGNGTVLNAAIQPYITGSTLKGEYTFVVSTGIITGVNWPDTDDATIVWDATNAKWQKP
jgi:type IV pilus assembly protein PilA